MLPRWFSRFTHALNYSSGECPARIRGRVLTSPPYALILVSCRSDRKIEVIKDHIAFLQDAIHHGCASEHIETAHVDKRFEGQPVWKGAVEVFKVPDHPKANQLYTWGVRESDDRPDWKAITVLDVSPTTNASQSRAKIHRQ